MKDVIVDCLNYSRAALDSFMANSRKIKSIEN